MVVLVVALLLLLMVLMVGNLALSGSVSTIRPAQSHPLAVPSPAAHRSELSNQNIEAVTPTLSSTDPRRAAGDVTQQQ